MLKDARLPSLRDKIEAQAKVEVKVKVEKKVNKKK